MLNCWHSEWDWGILIDVVQTRVQTTTFISMHVSCICWVLYFPPFLFKGNKVLNLPLFVVGLVFQYIRYSVWLKQLFWCTYVHVNFPCSRKSCISVHFVPLAQSEIVFFVLDTGAKCLIPVGLGDDDQSIEDDFSAWYAPFGNSFSRCYKQFEILFPPEFVENVSDLCICNDFIFLA